MNKLTQELLASLARKALVLLSGWLIARGVFTSEQGDSFIKIGLEYAAEWLPLILASVWAYISVKAKRSKLVTALTMPVGATENDVIAKIKSGEPTPTVMTPPNTIPGVPDATPPKP